jgi:hypothetical protein
MHRQKLYHLNDVRVFEDGFAYALDRARRGGFAQEQENLIGRISQGVQGLCAHTGRACDSKPYTFKNRDQAVGDQRANHCPR